MKEHIPLHPPHVRFFGMDAIVEPSTHMVHVVVEHAVQQLRWAMGHGRIGHRLACISLHVRGMGDTLHMHIDMCFTGRTHMPCIP